MAKLIRMMMAVIGAALLNKMLNGSFWSSKNSMHSENRSNHLQAIQEIVFAFLLSRSKGGWLMPPAAISTATALLAALINSVKKENKSKDRIIEIDEYKVIE
jgi:hypothetical protein